MTAVPVHLQRTGTADDVRTTHLGGSRQLENGKECVWQLLAASEPHRPPPEIARNPLHASHHVTHITQ